MIQHQVSSVGTSNLLSLEWTSSVQQYQHVHSMKTLCHPDHTVVLLKVHLLKLSSDN